MIPTLRSYLAGHSHQADRDLTLLHDPSSGEVVARASSAGADFGAALAWAHERGGPALRALSFAARGELLKAMSKALRERRAELFELSRRNNGTTESDGSFDIDGATGTLAYYAGVGKSLGERRTILDGEVVGLSRNQSFWGRHLLVSRRGVAVHINAFNFPAWGFAEKAAQALLAGMPVITKPATSTALLAARCVEIVLEAGILPEGALQLVCGSTGDLLDRLGPQDVLAFTGSAATARALRSRRHLLEVNARFNVEADSLNAAVLGPDAGEAVFALFLKDVVREMTQKAGQKCTAVRRILVPEARLREVSDALVARLGAIVTGDPVQPETTMGPLATAAQLEDAERGVEELRRAGAELRLGSGRREGERGYFLAPTLLAVADARAASAVHEREVFAPVATLLPYDDSAADAAAIVALGGGTLVTSAYSDDQAWLDELVAGCAATTGRFYVGTSADAAEAPGSGAALPQTQHGGPGRAGGGEELGGLGGVRLYLQRVAIQGDKPLLARLAGDAGEAPAPA
jgi:oxepin-CoA hydrolase/3-oxo-5,6-dehydrosuberyl-CoA semialdehyde dehydrogenase